MEITAGIYRAEEASANMAHSNVYTIVNGKGIAIVDTGLRGNAKKIVEYVKKIGHQPAEITTILITHFHMDHIGSLKELKEIAVNAKVAAHELDADFISGKKPMPKPRNIMLRAASSFIKPEPVSVDIPLNENDKIANLTVFHTPGHTPGSIALLDENEKAIFVGDTLRYDGKKITGAAKQYTLDAAREKESIKKIAKLDFEIMLPGHGDPLVNHASDLVKKFAESLQ